MAPVVPMPEAELRIADGASSGCSAAPPGSTRRAALVVARRRPAVRTRTAAPQTQEPRGHRWLNRSHDGSHARRCRRCSARARARSSARARKRKSAGRSGTNVIVPGGPGSAQNPGAPRTATERQREQRQRQRRTATARRPAAARAAIRPDVHDQGGRPVAAAPAHAHRIRQRGARPARRHHAARRSQFAADTQVGLFDNTASAQTVPELLADQYLDRGGEPGAEHQRHRTASSAATRPAPTARTACSGFVERFGRRAYRRPLAQDEVTSLIAIYDDTKTASDARDRRARRGHRGARVAELPVPPRVRRRRLRRCRRHAAHAVRAGLAPRVAALGVQPRRRAARRGRERRARDQGASRGASAAHADGRARAPALSRVLRAVARACRCSRPRPRTRPSIPTGTTALRAAMAEETRRFVAHVLWEDDAKLSTLMTGVVLVPERAARQAVRRERPEQRRRRSRRPRSTSRSARACSRRPSVMSAFASPSGSSPIKRGKLVRVRLLCQDLPDPPANVPPPDSARSKASSTRERFAMHTNNDACQRLPRPDRRPRLRARALRRHRRVPHDGSRRRGRRQRRGQPHAATSTARTAAAPSWPALLAMSDQVRDCVPTQWLRYALARREGERRHLLAGRAARRVRRFRRRPARADGRADADRRVLELQEAGVGGAHGSSMVISRRALLGGLGAAAWRRSCRAARRRARRRRARRASSLVHVPEGMWSGAPRPAAGGTDLGPILGALQPYQSKMLVMNNMNMASRDHGPGGDGHHRGVPHMFTCTEMQDENNAGGASIDQKIANAIGGSSQFPSLQFAVRIVYGDTNARPHLVGTGPRRAGDAEPVGGVRPHLQQLHAADADDADAQAEVDLRKQRARPRARRDRGAARAAVHDRPRADRFVSGLAARASRSAWR